MGEVTLKVRVKAIDEVSPVLKKIKGGAASLGAGMSKAAGFMQSPMGAAMAGGAIGGGVVALASALQGMMSQVVDIAKRIFNVLVDSSGILTQVSKMWNAAIMEVFRPIGDMLGLAIMPAMIDLNKTTASTYSQFLQNIRDGMDVNDALAIATEQNTEALGLFISSVIPAFEQAIGPITDLITEMIVQMAPALTTALGEAAPKIGAAMYQGFAQPGIKTVTDALGMGGPNSGAEYVENAKAKGSHSPYTAWFVENMMQAGIPQILEAAGFKPNAGANAVGLGGYAGPSSAFDNTPGGPYGKYAVSINYYGNVYGQETVEQTVRNALDSDYSRNQRGGV